VFGSFIRRLFGTTPPSEATAEGVRPDVSLQALHAEFCRTFCHRPRDNFMDFLRRQGVTRLIDWLQWQTAICRSTRPPSCPPCGRHPRKVGRRAIFGFERASYHAPWDGPNRGATQYSVHRNPSRPATRPAPGGIGTRSNSTSPGWRKGRASPRHGSYGSNLSKAE